MKHSMKRTKKLLFECHYDLPDITATDFDWQKMFIALRDTILTDLDEKEDENII